jgi:phosphonate transport system ATP-binding protein
MPTAINVVNLKKTFGTKDKARAALDDISFSIKPGEMVALIGASGSGKSTLLRHIAGLIPADRGPQRCHISVAGRCVQEKGRINRDVRGTRAQIGFIFQQFNLIDRLSVLTNVLCGVFGNAPAWRTLLKLFTADEKRRAMNCLDRVGIAAQAGQRASTLSGGQQQRAAIARAMVQKARVILADEPIASLDPASSKLVMDQLSTINREDNVTVVVSLHQVEYARRYCPRTIALRDGKIVYDGPSAALTTDLLRSLYGAATDALELGDKVHEAPRAAPVPRPVLEPVPALG